MMFAAFPVAMPGPEDIYNFNNTDHLVISVPTPTMQL
jgi:hypothetical protein